jgi:hypothetical protein
MVERLFSTTSTGNEVWVVFVSCVLHIPVRVCFLWCSLVFEVDVNHDGWTTDSLLGLRTFHITEWMFSWCVESVILPYPGIGCVFFVARDVQCCCGCRPMDCQPWKLNHKSVITWLHVSFIWLQMLGHCTLYGKLIPGTVTVESV